MSPEFHTAPPFDYKSVGPWFVSHEQDGKVIVGQVYAIESAVRRMWAMSAPETRFSIFDARGVTVMGVNPDHMVGPYMVGTREFLEATLAMCERTVDPGEVVSVLRMVEDIRAAGGALP